MSMMSTAKMKPAVFIIDDDLDVRRSLSLLVKSVDLDAQTYATAALFLEQYRREQPGCLVLDVRMPGMTGLELQKELTERGIRIPIIFISAFGEIQMATSTLRKGAIDFVTKPFSPQYLLERIHEAIQIDVRRREDEKREEDIARRLDSLTAREREVMVSLSEGDSTKKIASKLNISPKTVDNHRTKVFEKMRVDNAAQLLRLLTRSHDSSESMERFGIRIP